MEDRKQHLNNLLDKIEQAKGNYDLFKEFIKLIKSEHKAEIDSGRGDALDSYGWDLELTIRRFDVIHGIKKSKKDKLEDYNDFMDSFKKDVNKELFSLE